MGSRSAAWCFVFTTLAACGGNGGGTAAIPESIGTLAYVVSTCRENTEAAVYGFRLDIRRGEDDSLTVREITPEPLPHSGLCQVVGQFRFGTNSVAASPFQRIGVSPDGSRVVFELTDDFSILSTEQVPPVEEGIYVVGADGSGLRRLGPASREPTFRTGGGSCALGNSTQTPVFQFSPGGDRIAYVDRGPDRAGADAVQIVTLNLDTGGRTQVTHLQPQTPDPCLPYLLAGPPVFLDEETIAYATAAGAAGSVAYTVKADGQSEPQPLPIAIPLPGAVVVPGFSITGSAEAVYTLRVSGTFGSPDEVDELFVSSGENLLQLTSFGRGDTAIEGGVLSRDRQRVFFGAAADPLGSNPGNNCQFFSSDTLGSDLRQLTSFSEGQPSLAGCSTAEPRPLGCLVDIVGHDPQNDMVVFESSCDPLGTNPNGDQIFAMRFDGTGLRQLTHTRGLTVAEDGTVTVELPGPAAYRSGP